VAGSDLFSGVIGARRQAAMMRKTAVPSIHAERFRIHAAESIHHDLSQRESPNHQDKRRDFSRPRQPGDATSRSTTTAA
jgi:hypothetical protein